VTELGDVLAHLAGVALEVPLALVHVVGAERSEVRLDRDLRVDHDALPAGELHDHVRPEETARVVALALLLVEVAVLNHPGELDDALQLHFAPTAAHVRRAQRRHEVAGLGAEPLLSFGDRLQLLANHRDGLQPLLLERL